MSMRLITWNGITDSVSGWAERYNMNPSTLRCRLKKGMSIEDALEKPLQVQNKNGTSENDMQRSVHKKKKCAKCKYAFVPSGYIYCDYLDYMWTTTGKPRRRPCPAENCTVFERRSSGKRRRQGW